MSEAAHTTTPWHRGGSSLKTAIFDGNGLVAEATTPEYAAFIVRAANAYQPMLEALKEADKALKAVHEYFEARKTLALAEASTETPQTGGLTDEPAFGTDAIMEQLQKRGES